MKRTNKVIAMILAVITVFSAMIIIPATTSAKETNVVSKITTIAKGKCGKEATWKLDSKGLLTVSGKGTVDNFDKLFDYNIEVKNVKIGNGITKVDKYAFKYCSKLEKATIGTGVVSLSPTAFCYSGRITTYVVAKGNKKLCSVNGVIYNKNKSKIILYPRGNKRTKYTILKGTKTIGEYAFKSAENLKTVVIPSTVTKIESSVFIDCENLKKLTIPKSVKSIGDLAYGFCIYDYDEDEDLYWYVFPYGATIYGKEGSAAHRYSRNFNIKFVKIK